MVEGLPEQVTQDRHAQSRVSDQTCRNAAKGSPPLGGVHARRHQCHPRPDQAAAPALSDVAPAASSAVPPPPSLDLTQIHSQTSAATGHENTTISFPPAIIPAAFTGNSARASFRHSRPKSSDLRNDSFLVRSFTIKDETSSSSPLASSRPSRTQTPQLSGSNDAASQMHISRLSLDEHGNRSPLGRGYEVHAARRLDPGSPSKKRPASSDAQNPRQVQARTRYMDDTALGRVADANPQSALIDELRRPTTSTEGQHDFRTNDLGTHPQRNAPHGHVRTQAHHPYKDHGLPSDLSYPNIPMDGSQTMSKATEGPPRTEQLVREKATTRISKDRLVAETNNLYTSLESVEGRCIILAQAQAAKQANNGKTDAQTWNALTSLHRTLLYEHHDFLLASQHPCAPPELRALAAERQIPFRLWKHAIHACLDLLRQQLPTTFELMESFIYTAYQMMALLFETVPAFQDVWIECLGDLARYRMAIESQSGSVRETWSKVAEWWYTKASDRQPLIGRLYHHLGILARPRLAKQLYYYCKSLCCVQSFPNAKHSLRAVFGVAVGPPPEPINELDHQFVQLHKLLFEATRLDDAKRASLAFVCRLEQTMPRTNKKWKELGVFLAISNIAACFSYGEANDPLRQALAKGSRSATNDPTGPQDRTLITAPRPESWPWQKMAHDNIKWTMLLLLVGEDDECALPHIHVIMVLLQSLCTLGRSCPAASQLLLRMPWAQLVTKLNSLARKKLNMLDGVRDAVSADKLFSAKGMIPLLEDSAMRGLVWCEEAFPKRWFDDIDRDRLPEQEAPNADRCRRQRILWSATRIASTSSYLRFDKATGTFEVGQGQAAEGLSD